jgi:hypothetical protein
MPPPLRKPSVQVRWIIDDAPAKLQERRSAAEDSELVEGGGGEAGIGGGGLNIEASGGVGHGQSSLARRTGKPRRIDDTSGTPTYL